ncbi:MAG: GNAT family N-acetyltransferase [Acidobacteriota bacterium]|nr:GNAT family N-acetyltransferase [Acidobacteriota bacterium]
MSDYSFRLLDLSDAGIDDMTNLLKLVFQDNVKSPEFIRWQYNLNPAGPAVGYNAYRGDVLAAHYVTQPMTALFQGKKVKGLLSLNTATHPDHRGKKLFTILAEMTYDHARTQGYEFVIGVANADSTHGFLRKLGFTLVKPLDVKIGMGTFAVPEEDPYEYRRDWDRDLLEWRLANPKVPYETKRWGDHFAVLAPTGKMGVKAVIGYFPMSLYPEKPLPRPKRSANPVKIWLGSDPRLTWKKNLYFNFPKKLKPSPLNLIFKDLTDGNRTVDAETLRFMAIDFDAY